jgi:hypothetical protein
MKKENTKQQPFKVRLPGFLVENEIGLGEVIKRATSTVGIKPCGNCEQRASMLNNWFVFTGKTK